MGAGPGLGFDGVGPGDRSCIREKRMAQRTVRPPQAPQVSTTEITESKIRWESTVFGASTAPRTLPRFDIPSDAIPLLTPSM